MTTDPTSSDRRHDLDWLRVLATLNVFLFHSARFFNDDDWHVKNDILSVPASVFIGFTVVYIMPLFFVLSAVGSTYSLERRGLWEYFKERVKRLFVPYLFGILLVIAPIQVWIERVTHPPFYPDGFIPFMLHDYFHGLYLFGGNFAWVGIHLWYLLFLFVFSVFTMPLFRSLLRPGPTRVIARLARVASRPGGLYLYLIPIALMELWMNSHPDTWGQRDAGGWSAGTYLVIFVVAFIVFRERSLQAAITAQRGLNLIIALAFTAFFSAVKLADLKFGPPGFFIWSIGWPAAMWSWILAILGYAGRHLNFNHPRLPYLNDLVLPFYILHQTVIVCLGYLIRHWDWPVALKYPFVLIVCFPTIILLYEFGVRRWRLTRFLFGMKEKKPAASATPATPASAPPPVV